MAVKDLVKTKKCLFICNGGSCMKKDGEEVTQAIRKRIKDTGLDDEYHTIRTKCMGRCDDAPIAMVSPDNIWLKNIDYHQCALLLNEIESGKMKQSQSFLFLMGEQAINSESIPTKQRKKLNQNRIENRI